MSPIIRLYPACYTGDIQAISSRPPDVVHINLQYKKWTEVQGIWLRTTMPIKHKYMFKNNSNWNCSFILKTKIIFFLIQFVMWPWSAGIRWHSFFRSPGLRLCKKKLNYQLVHGGVVDSRRCGGLVVRVLASRSPVPGSNLGPGPRHVWSEGRQITL